jgi:GTP-binding protein
VGKSSLINYLTDKKALAQVSASPGKTKLINHFLINEAWYLVDLPGYGWAKTSKTAKEQWDLMTKNYLSNRRNLLCAFVLIDINIPPQQIDLDFMASLAHNAIPFSIIFTKIDKSGKTKIQTAIEEYKNNMNQYWEQLPDCFACTSSKKTGKEEILAYIQNLIVNFDPGAMPTS